ncbi:MAG: leucyl/phenylalanyl-tRNA--protein transferase [Chitinophagaceae bacterium]
MAVWSLEEELWFPPAEKADEDGLLAVGGDLNAERLLLAYRSGIFPWFSEEDPILWWSPDPRFVLFPEKLRVSKSMKQVLRNGLFDYRRNTEFELVIRACAAAPRAGQPGTWISEVMIEAYVRLHDLGIAQSAETWQDGQLVGGLYGVLLGNVFFGESMFSKVSNASKAAFIQMVQDLKNEGVKVIDCQMHTAHLESLGAESISRVDFLRILLEEVG